MKKSLAMSLFFLVAVLGMHIGRWNHQRAYAQTQVAVPVSVELSSSATQQQQNVEATCPQPVNCGGGGIGHCSQCGSESGHPTCCFGRCQSAGCKLTVTGGTTTCSTGVACTT